jgi:hemin uptake protein HemP
MSHSPHAKGQDTTGSGTQKTPSDRSNGNVNDTKLEKVQASDLLGPRRIVQIEHEGEVYTLRITRNNRLILTK